MYQKQLRNEPNKKINLLMVEDSEIDAELVISILEENGFQINCKRVDTEDQMKKMINQENWDIVISDYTMPKFRCTDALKILKAHNPNIPFILVSGAVGEEVAVDMMKQGASDYIMKNKINRLPEAVKREIEESKIRSKLKESENRYQKLVELSPDGIIIENDNGIEFINQAGIDFLGIQKKEEIIGKSFLNFVPSSYKILFNEYLTDLRTNKKTSIIKEGKFKRKDNEIRDSEFTLSPFVLNKKTEIQIIFRDITDKKRAEHLAYKDTLTSLGTRISLETLLNKAIDLAERDKKLLAILFLDLDNFKPINDNFGHETGDFLLNTIGHRIKSNVRKSDIAARIGGDEFIIVFTNITSKDKFKKLFNKFLLTLKEPIKMKNKVLKTSMSIGISFFPDHGKDVHTLINKADIAMYKAKNSGKNNFNFYEED